MQPSYMVIAAAAAAGLLWFLLAPRWRISGREKQLEKEYCRLLQMTEAEGKKVIARQIEALAKKHPGRSRIWYLEKALYDLRRDR